MPSFLRPRGSISAALRARRALLLAEGRRRFYVYPCDVGVRSALGSVPRMSPGDCIAAAHEWLGRALASGSWPFTIVERAEMGHESVWVSEREVLVFPGLVPILRSGGTSHSASEASRPVGPCEAERRRGIAERVPKWATFKAGE